MLQNNYLRMRMRSGYIIYTMAKGSVVDVRLMELNIEASMKNAHCTSAWHGRVI